MNRVLGEQTVIDDAEVRDPKIGGVVLARQALAGQVRALCTVHDGRFVWDLVRQWLVIGAAATLAVWSQHWAGYVLAILVIATRQHALGILMHDGTHFRLLANRKANDAVCDLFCAFPVGMTTSRYRFEHLLHHRYLNTDNDPYWVDFQRDDTWHWPKRTGAALWVFARDLTLVNSSRWGKVMHRWSPWINHFPSDSPREGPPTLTGAERFRVYAFHVTVLGAFAVTGTLAQFALLWLVPLMTITPALVRLRTIGEHLAIPNRNELDASRHTEGSWFEKLTVAPFNINYHLDHHLFPAVPYYKLPELHKLLMTESTYVDRAILNRRYFGFGEGALLQQIVTPGSTQD